MSSDSSRAVALLQEIAQGQKDLLAVNRELATLLRDGLSRERPVWDGLIGMKEMSELLGLHDTTIERRYEAGTILRPFKVGGKRVWRHQEVVDWIAARCPDPATWRWPGPVPGTS